MLGMKRRFLNLMMMSPDDGGGAGGDGGAEGEKGGAKEGGDTTFTQEDLNRIGAKENAAGKSAALKALGFEDEKSAKAFLEAAKADADAKKTQSQKDQEERDLARKEAQEYKSKASLLEQRLEVIKKGANPKTVDDLVTLVRSRVNETVDFDTALEEVKKIFPTFFEKDKEDGAPGGTGGAGSPPRKPAGKEDGKGIGQRLAGKKALAPTDAGKEYFSKN